MITVHPPGVPIVSPCAFHRELIFDKIGVGVGTEIMILNMPKLLTYMFQIQNIFYIWNRIFETACNIKGQVHDRRKPQPVCKLSINKSVFWSSIVFMVSVIRYQPGPLVEDLSLRKQILNCL